jgi:hypothetical protein
MMSLDSHGGDRSSMWNHSAVPMQYHVYHSMLGFALTARRAVGVVCVWVFLVARGCCLAVSSGQGTTFCSSLLW